MAAFKQRQVSQQGSYLLEVHVLIIISNVNCCNENGGRWITAYNTMAKLEELTQNTAVTGLIPQQTIKVVNVDWHSDNSLTLYYKTPDGMLGEELLYRHDEIRLEIVADPRQWQFDGDGTLLKLVSEAQRIRWAHLFDPYLAVHTSMVVPLPHQITAVYDKMLPRQPLRFLLADDPGAGKTIMAGLLIKELIIRGDLQRCLIVCPGSLAEQWQEELHDKFHLPFQLLTNDRLNSGVGDVFRETDFLIARLDKLARNEELQARLEKSEWDLIVCDEAHKMSATFFGGEINYTKRYRLGQILGRITRHLLLMTATPHNGKEEDFQLFLSLIDPDRFEGRFREGVHDSDAADLMRRMVKEQLLTFASKPLFPERRAYTVPYALSPLERELYEAVTAYVREEFNRAEALANNGRAGTVGFALTLLQRRLASSTAAIHQSLLRRRQRLQERLLAAEQLVFSGETGRFPLSNVDEELDEDDFTAEELEDLQNVVIDQATAALTIEELRQEIETLTHLEALGRQARQSDDRKWVELRGLLEDQPEMKDASGRRRKLVIFTEHKDTLTYLLDNMRALIGRPESVVVIHGGLKRQDRRAVEAAFRHDPQVHVLIATDAAGEGINLQQAHLMVNYDLPWNPNRLEQRFGRIHRIGQQEVCHLWNLVAEDTREGDVYATLLRKLEVERKSLGGAVFDVLGKAIDSQELRLLMIDAIRYGQQPEVRAHLHQAVENALDRERLETLIAEHALAHDAMDTTQVLHIRQEMERIAARRLQPHFVASFFKLAFRHLEGVMRPRETNRYEITKVPHILRRQRPELPPRYARICFHKEAIRVEGKPDAAFICPGHPLLEALIDVMLAQYQSLLPQGAVLLDKNDLGETPRLLFYLEHGIQDGRADKQRQRRLISRRFQFVETELPPAPEAGQPRFTHAGPSPYLDYEPLAPADRALVADIIRQAQATPRLEQHALAYAIEQIAPEHVAEIRAEREPLIAKTFAAVKARLTKEIIYWDTQAQRFREQAQAGKVNAALNAENAQHRADDLEVRRHRRLAELEQERNIASLPPRLLGAVLVIPGGLLARLKGTRTATFAQSAAERQRVEQSGMDTVMAVERLLGNTPQDVAAEKVGYDIVSTTPTGKQRFIEVKGRIADADEVILTRNEIMVALNKGVDWLLALVKVPTTPDFPDGDVVAIGEERGAYRAGLPAGCQVRYLPQPFIHEPDEDATSVIFNLNNLWARGQNPLAR